jgi:hypothetical protein
MCVCISYKLVQEVAQRPRDLSYELSSLTRALGLSIQIPPKAGCLYAFILCLCCSV